MIMTIMGRLMEMHLGAKHTLMFIKYYYSLGHIIFTTDKTDKLNLSSYLYYCVKCKY